ncbi:hypothetical protein [Shewanella maritima]|uniref:hypothetical protein n=1 Tax=Shewanella maritima TaxID=2520507 RepID=UPI0037352C38
MNVNATLMGQLLMVFILLNTTVCYFLAKKKSETPKVATLIGFFFSLFPLFGLIYVAVLAFKKNIQQ